MRSLKVQVDFISDNELARVVLSLKAPRIIGLSVLTISSKRAYELAAKIKKLDSKALIVLGNIHPTVLPEEALSYNDVDLVVRGEGEETLLELVQRITNKEDFTACRGISYKQGDQVHTNPDRSFIVNLDDLPPFPPVGSGHHLD